MDNKKAVIVKTTDNDDLVPEGRGFLHCRRLHKALIQMERFVIHDPLSWRTTVYFKYRNGVRLYMTMTQGRIIPDNCTGSLYKLICRELLLFLIVYSILGAVYREVMNPVQKR